MTQIDNFLEELSAATKGKSREIYSKCKYSVSKIVEVMHEPFDKEGVAKEFIKIVKDYFDNELKRPELLGRIGYNNIVPFNFIQDRDFQIKICKNKLKPVIRGIEEKYKLELEFEKELESIEYILKAVDSSKGGRDILNAINDRLLDPLAMFLFENKDELRSLKGSRIIAKVTKDGFSFDFD